MPLHNLRRNTFPFECDTGFFMGGANYNPWPLLSKVTCPTLVIEGEASENRAFIDLKKATRIFGQGAYKLVNGAGHLIPQEKPRESLEIIRSFCSPL